jgi:hypothetical protein
MPENIYNLILFDYFLKRIKSFKKKIGRDICLTKYLLELKILRRQLSVSFKYFFHFEFDEYNSVSHRIVKYGHEI